MEQRNYAPPGGSAAYTPRRFPTFVMDFIKRHKRKLFVTVGVVAGGFLATSWLKTKFFELQDRIMNERLAKENLEKRFEQNQKDATFTILALLPSLGTNILGAYDVEAIRRELQSLKQTQDAANLSDSTSAELAGSAIAPPMAEQPLDKLEGSFVTPKSKAELWDQIKIQSLTRALTLIYSSVLLVLLTRIQINVLGRDTYVASVKELAGGETLSLDAKEDQDHINRQYLTFSWWLINKGWESLGRRIQAAVELSTAKIDPLTELTAQQVDELLGNIQFNIEHPRELEGSSFLANVLPPHELETYVLTQAPGTVVAPIEVTGKLREMLNETADLIESTNTVQVLQKLVHTGLSVLMEKLKPHFPQQDSTAKLASVLAVSTKQAHQMTAGHPLGNDYVDAMVASPELDALCAVIYTNF